MSLSKMFYWLLVIAVIGIQFIKIEKSNPPVEKDLQASAEVKDILKVACYDCHSNETVWPWYSKVAPISFFVANHVNEGRRHLNFSNWGNLYTPKQRELKKEIWEEVEGGKMPINNYTWLHSKANLTPDQLKILKSWSRGEKY